MTVESVSPVCPDCECRRIVLGTNPPTFPVRRDVAWCVGCRVERPAGEFIPRTDQTKEDS